MTTTKQVPGNRWRLGAGALLLVLLAACGGGKEEPQEEAYTGPPVSGEEAARFLTQATYGPSPASLEEVKRRGYSRWIDVEMAKPQTLHRAYIEQLTAAFAAQPDPKPTVSQTHFRESYWTQALAGNDQLRQRAAFALSEIFVVSFVDSNLSDRVRGMSSYYDMLGENAFGNYRDLLEKVSLHPMMGLYLTSMRNQKEDGKGRVADENYAREIMQLFSIGLYELNNDGSYKGGTPTETYTHEDIQGLAKVFTGWSWYAGPALADRTDRRFAGNDANPDREIRSMQAYAKYHSVGEKKFLGTTIAAGSSDGDADLKIALDRLYNHPNTGPFFGRLLIQRMVTSNPSPAYVARVAAAFNNNGSGVRGDLKAVFRAVLLDPEARTYDATNNKAGKVREPLLRLSNFLRAFKATSTNGRFSGIDNTDNPVSNLGQTVLRSPTVFNFYRPGYTPPNSDAAAAGLVSPELQMANEVSVAGYLNYIRGSWLPVSTNRDIQVDFSAEMALATNAADLVDRIDLMLTSGQMTDALRAQIIAAVNGRVIPTASNTTQAQRDSALRDRVCIAIMLTMGSPEYLIQK